MVIFDIRAKIANKLVRGLLKIMQRTKEPNNVLRRRAQEAKGGREPCCATTCYFVEHYADQNLAV